jgi:hypothetical protein
MDTSELFDEHCPIRRGDSADTVMSRLGLDKEPEVYQPSSSSPPGYQHRAESLGIWVFYDASKIVRTIRLDSPFAGKVGGVAIGTPRNQVRAVLGKPSWGFEIENGDAWVYGRPGETVRYNIGRQSKCVESILA